MPDRARTPRSQAPQTGIDQQDMPTSRLPTQPYPGGVGPAPTVATENATPNPIPRRSAAPLELTSMGSAFELRMRVEIRQICATTKRFAAPLWHPRHVFGGCRHDPVAAQGQAFGDGSPETASSCERRTRSRWAV